MKSIENILGALNLAATQLFWILSAAEPSTIGPCCPPCFDFTFWLISSTTSLNFLDQFLFENILFTILFVSKVIDFNFKYGLTQWKVRHGSTTLLKDIKPNSTFNTSEIIRYSTQHNMSSTRQFDPSFIFSPYLEFYNFKLHEVGFVWKITFIPTIFVNNPI